MNSGLQYYRTTNDVPTVQTQPVNSQYARKQKECQEIHIRSTDPTVYISLPNLLPEFKTIASSIGMSDQDMYYQVKSFRTANRFYNVLPTDTITLKFDVVYHSENTPDNIVYQLGQDLEGITINLNTYDENLILTSEDLVDLINQRINDVVLSYHTEPFSGIQLSNFMNVFACSRFVFNSSSGKLEFELGPRTNYKVMYNNYSPLLSASAKFKEIYVYLYANFGQSTYNQIRMAKLLGVVNEITYSLTTTETEIDTGVTNTALAHAFSVLNFEDLVAKTTDYNTEIPFVDALYINCRPANSYYVRSACPIPMNAMRYHQIHIRSTLQSNIWRKDGTKSNQIAVIPLSGSISDMAVEYQPSSVGERCYNIKDSLSGLQSFSISFTDEFEQAIDFNEEYYLVIALFFQPPC